KDYAYFNVWANRRLVDWLRDQTPELLEKETPSSFPSLKQTFLHIWSAEKVWMERLQQVPILGFLQLTFQGSSEEVLDGLLGNAEELAAYINSLDAPDLDLECDFRLLNGTEDRRPRSEMILHCLQHSTYHRGQIVTMARALGLTDPPNTDYMRYLRERER
ncbi:MAG: DinB family protein, partial [Saprospiraceae bacterium]